MAGYGVDDVVPPPPPTNGQMTNGTTNGNMLTPYVVTDQRGYTLVKPAVTPKLMEMLALYGTAYITPTRVAIRPFTPEQLQAAKAGDPMWKSLVENQNAAKWVQDQVKAGGCVIGSASTLLMVLMSDRTVTVEPAPEIASVPVGTQEAKDAAKFPTMVVFAGDPDKKVSAPAAPGEDWMAKIGGPVGIAIIAGVAVGGIYLLTRKKKRY